MRTFSLCLLFFPGLSLPRSNQAGTWGVNKLHKLEICFVRSISSSPGLTPPLLPHAEKEQNTKWMWAVENTPSQEAAVQMAVARGHQGKWKNDCPLVYSKSLIGVSTFQTVVPMLWFCDDKNWTFIIIFAEINFQNNPNKTRYWRKLKIRKWGKLQ